jgi:hypothetical protein
VLNHAKRFDGTLALIIEGLFSNAEMRIERVHADANEPLVQGADRNVRQALSPGVTVDLRNRDLDQNAGNLHHD